MKNIIVLIILITGVCVLSSCTFNNEESKTVKNEITTNTPVPATEEPINTIEKTPETPPFTKPPITNIPDIEYPQSYHHLDYIDETKISVDHYADRNEKKMFDDFLFAPIGWSKDGKLAYIATNFGSYNDGVSYFRWVIQDMVTDEHLWESGKGYEEYLWDYEFSDEREKFKLVYANYIDKYKEKLDEYGIIINKDLKLEEFPLSFNENTYNGKITDLKLIKDKNFGDMVNEYKVVVERNGVSKIFSYNQYVYSKRYIFDVAICGYIKSPYEPRIAVVISEIGLGYEGPPLPIDSIFVGCRLEKGFDVIIEPDEALELLIEKHGPDSRPNKGFSFYGIDKETGFYMFSWANPGYGTGGNFLVDPCTGDVYNRGKKTSNLLESSNE